MKKKALITASLSLCLALAASITSFAGSWQKNETGWWWQNDDGTWPANTWQWLDGNGDGVAECYYFNESGYMLASTTTPDNYVVNENGAWTVDGAIQTKSVSLTTSTTASTQTTSKLPKLIEACPYMSNVKYDVIDSMSLSNLVGGMKPGTAHCYTMPISDLLDANLDYFIYLEERGYFTAVANEIYDADLSVYDILDASDNLLGRVCMDITGSTNGTWIICYFD